jgi:serine/threonine protein phosphatase 1
MIYAVGDIHGNFTLLCRIYDKILKHIETKNDPFGAKIIFLGDYIDRGKENFKVIDFLNKLKDRNDIQHIFLYGNHEKMFIEAETDKKVMQMWLENGGETFLKEIRINFNNPQHVFTTKEYNYIKKFIQTKTVLLYNDVDYTFVHGAFNKQLPVNKQKEDFVIWGRMEPQYYDTHTKMVVHGHTPPKDLKPYKYNNVINIDIGCGFRQRLCAVALPHIRNDEEIEFIIHEI